MNTIPLNVIYIGPQTFPVGGATTKRRRYMVDYMNSNGIQSHYLVTALSRDKSSSNIPAGTYGKNTFYDLSSLAVNKHFIRYIQVGKEKLKEWFDESKTNVLIFHTLVNWNEWPFYKYAKKLGYKIIFDQVETSYLQNNTGSFLFKMQVRLSEYLSHKAYKECPAFVISTALYKENQEKYPGRKLCLLPNSTPIIKSELKTEFNDPLLLLYSGTYTPKDGVLDLINGVIRAHMLGVNCKLILLGKGNSQDMKALDKVKSLDYVEYRGYVSDEELEETLKSCDILCMTRTNSLFANFGFPFKLSEYLSTGNILLATDVGDVSMYVENKVSAFIVEPESPKSIAEAIIYIDKHHEEALNVAHRGYNAMQMFFSIEKVGKTLVAFINEI